MKRFEKTNKSGKEINQLIPLLIVDTVSFICIILARDDVPYGKLLDKSIYTRAAKLLVCSHAISQYFMRGYSWMSTFYLSINFAAFGLTFSGVGYTNDFFSGDLVSWFMASYGPARLIINWSVYNNKKRYTMGGLIALSFAILLYAEYMNHSKILFTISSIFQCSSALFSYVFESSPSHKRNLGLIIIIAFGCVFLGNSDYISSKPLKNFIMGTSTWMLSGYGPGRYAREKSVEIKRIMNYAIPISILLQSIGVYCMLNNEISLGYWYRLLGTWFTSALSVCAILTRLFTNQDL